MFIMNGFHLHSNFFSLIPKEIYGRIYQELPEMVELFPYEISASDISHVQRQYYGKIKPIPYGIITFIYFSVHMNQWVVVEVNRFHKISTVWTIHVQSPANSRIYTGIHVFPETGAPTFVEIRGIGPEEVLPHVTWAYTWTFPQEWPVDTDLSQSLIDITLQTPYPIYHFQFVPLSPQIPDTIIRVRDIIEADRPPVELESDTLPSTTHIQDGRVETFRVRAGKEWDTFYLYAKEGKELVYYRPLYIQNLEQSLAWNAMFRSVQRPDSLDWIEKCEKELRHKHQGGRKCTVENYQKMDVDMIRTARCQYHAKFQQWIPIEFVPGTCRIVQMRELIPLENI